MRRFLSVFVTVALGAGLLAVGSTVTAHTGHTITVSDITAPEVSGTGTFNLALNPAPQAGETISIRIATANASASGVATPPGCPAPPGNPNSDYVTVPSTTVTWTEGQTAKFQSVTICDDSTSESTETFVLNLSEPSFTCTLPACTQSAAPTFDPQAIATITDNESGPGLLINDRALPEGNGTTTANFVFTVTLSSPSNQTVTVNYATSDGTASGTSDYAPQSGTLTFAPNATTAEITIGVNPDVTPEPDETFFVNLFVPTNATIFDNQGTGTIQSDETLSDGATTLTISDVSRAEGNTGSSPSTPFTFTVTMNRRLATDSTISYFTTDGTASVGPDYTFTGGNLTIPANSTAGTVTVPVFGDTAQEANETFSLNLSSQSCGGCTFTKNTGLGTITNDDGTAPPPPADTIVKLAGYFQVRVTAAAPCAANRLVKVKQSVAGRTDPVITQGKTNADGVLKKAVRPRKRGRFYAQIYTTTVGSTTCAGKKSPVTLLPA